MAHGVSTLTQGLIQPLWLVARLSASGWQMQYNLFAQRTLNYPTQLLVGPVQRLDILANRQVQVKGLPREKAAPNELFWHFPRKPETPSRVPRWGAKSLSQTWSCLAPDNHHYFVTSLLFSFSLFYFLFFSLFGL